MATSTWHDLSTWFATPLGERLLAEQAPHLQEIARRFHGDSLLWAGCQTRLTETVRGCMVRNRLYSLGSDAVALGVHADDERGYFYCELDALPLPNGSMDALLVHHLLEGAEDPRTAVREIARVLRPGGRLVVCGFNPASVWGLRTLLGRPGKGALSGLRFLRPARIVDWLTVLGFELSESVQHMAYGMPFAVGAPSAAETEPVSWYPRHWGGRLRKLLDDHRPPFGGVYIIVAVKQAAAVRPDFTAMEARPGKLNPVAYPKLSSWKGIERPR